ncbi:GNAT family N-acetyltransferase [Kribbella sp. NPDC051587]|uniref:GNAT family N-acetyltransferase n=1 Tax=Kribbella sp. NPDC051587 TaxID=3364119 RepID=UPI0037880E5E
MTVTVRPAVAADSDAIASIWYVGWADGHLGHVPEDLVAIRTKESFWTRAADRIGDATVAVVGDDIAGFVMVVDDEVEQVYVSSDHRGSGVAGVLLTEAERQVAANGHDEAWLAVVAGNARARRFYERCGWADTGRFDYPASVERGTLPVPCHRYVKAVTSDS